MTDTLPSGGINDGEFIASCAGNAEAGWVATRAAIVQWLALIKSAKGWEDDNGCAGCAIHHFAYPALDSIIAAWPEEML